MSKRSIYANESKDRWGDSRAQAIIEAVEALDQAMGLEKLVHALSPPTV